LVGLLWIVYPLLWAAVEISCTKMYHLGEAWKFPPVSDSLRQILDSLILNQDFLFVFVSSFTNIGLVCSDAVYLALLICSCARCLYRSVIQS
jgi:hypothetical protein